MKPAERLAGLPKPTRPPDRDHIVDARFPAGRKSLLRPFHSRLSWASELREEHSGGQERLLVHLRRRPPPPPGNGWTRSAAPMICRPFTASQLQDWPEEGRRRGRSYPTPKSAQSSGPSLWRRPSGAAQDRRPDFHDGLPDQEWIVRYMPGPTRWKRPSPGLRAKFEGLHPP